MSRRARSKSGLPGAPALDPYSLLLDEVRAALPVVLRLADGGLQVALLVDHIRERLPRLLIVEGRLEMVRRTHPWLPTTS